MTCNTILGSWQDILRKTFLASGKQNHQTFLPMFVHEACFGVCIKGWPWAPADPAASLGPSLLTTLLIAVRPPQGRVPASPPMPSFAYFVLHNCKSYVLREEQSLSGCEGSRSSQCLGSRRLWESRRQGQSPPMGMASSPTSLVLPATGCARPSTNAVVIPGTVALILACMFSFSHLFPLLWTGGSSHLWDKVEPLHQQEELSGTLLRCFLGFFCLLVP